MQLPGTPEWVDLMLEHTMDLPEPDADCGFPEPIVKCTRLRQLSLKFTYSGMTLKCCMLSFCRSVDSILQASCADQNTLPSILLHGRRHVYTACRRLQLNCA
jgi:hypothetical protein